MDCWGPEAGVEFKQRFDPRTGSSTLKAPVAVSFICSKSWELQQRAVECWIR
jgi:hypothetical protein